MGVNVKPWITGVVNGIGPAVAASYAGEDATNQLGVDISSLTRLRASVSSSTDIATEAFDEPLTKAQVLAIVMPFIQ